MKQRNSFRLVTLGRIALLTAGGEDTGLATRRRKLVLLAVLAMSARPIPRDSLVDMFWGEDGEERARHSLSDALSHLRRVLGREAIAYRRSAVALSEDARLAVDAVEMASACEARDFARAVDLYAGPFLDGVHIDDSPRFEAWVDRERSRLERLFVQSCQGHCLALARARRWDECAAVALRWLDAAPRSPDAALYLLNARKAPGTDQALLDALGEYDALARRLARDEGAAPDARVAALAAELDAQIAARPPESGEPHPERAPAAPAAPTIPTGVPIVAPAGAPVPAPASAPAPQLAPPSTARRRGRRTAVAAIALVTLAAVAGAGITAARLLARHRAPAPPIVAITFFQNVRHDTSAAWLEDGLPQMIAADLARSRAVEVVAPSRVRDVMAREQLGASDSASTETARRIAGQLGATWSVTGGITTAGDHFVVDVGLHDVATGKLIGLYTETGADVLAIADAAAARILGAADAGTPGPRLADVETANVDAYQHFVRAEQAAAEGRSGDQTRELDAAIAADSGFATALLARLKIARDARDGPLVARLTRLVLRSSDRLTSWDRRSEALRAAQHNGERVRAEQLARDLVRRFPHDPRAYSARASVLTTYGEWAAADRVLHEALALDSLADAAGQGPCAPCAAYNGLVWLNVTTGKPDSAEIAARRWIALQPSLPAAWRLLATALTYAGDYDRALAAARRAAMLAGDDADYALDAGRILVMARRFRAADSAIAVWRARPEGTYHVNAGELEEIVERERGELRASNRTIFRLAARYPMSDALRLTAGNNLGRLGQWDAARRLYETHAHASGPHNALSPFRALDGDAARVFCWEHALEADAIAGSGDTARLRVLADSIAAAAVHSYYGRDWRLASHVRGLIAMRAHRYAEAAHDFEQARWGAAGWTVTLARLARARLALGQPRRAVAALRAAYAEPPDAMGRYQLRSELDLLMAVAFDRAGEADSSRVYATYVRRAWAHADPEVRAELAKLPDGDRPAAAVIAKR